MPPTLPADAPLFIDRAEAGQRLADHIASAGPSDAIVLGIPRGGIAVAAALAHRLGLALDVAGGRKRPPHEDEKRDAPRATIDLRGRAVVIVDDGMASGETMRSAIDDARARGARTIIVAVPVASRDGRAAIAAQCDRIHCPYILGEFDGVGMYYARFDPVSDAEVRHLLSQARSDHRDRATLRSHSGG